MRERTRFSLYTSNCLNNQGLVFTWLVSFGKIFWREYDVYKSRQSMSPHLTPVP